MKPILILQHVGNDGPAFFTEFLAARGLGWRTVRADRGEPLPDDIAAFSGYAILGGPISANDPLPYLSAAMALVRQAMGNDVPVIGHCLGGQLMAGALGAQVTRSPSPEIGWHEVRARSPAAARRWFGGELTFPQFQWHQEAFALPAGAEWLASSPHCPHQAFAVADRHIAMQFHTEVDAAKIADWLGPVGAAEIATLADAPGVQGIATIAARTPASIAASQRIAAAIYTAWCEGLRL
jgi:GMP synthase-like glutamine amidotransferase